ncbi:hypothetical protein EUX98_g3536 [Antrodiella citrinella]|uniref:Uncharacterized protein n=1 Tax=Antrodiella citrinella TaxID=2447956 RepID=A0A4S4MXD2_9APHY|nr:hypothetical protein EUX98_g3536 [Antrodiella citrinella]
MSSASGLESGLNDPNGYCKDLVRKRDYEAFLTSQFYPRQLQNAYYALRAFHIEVAIVQESVSNTMIGKMRMQFWNDALKGIADGSPPRHPIALALYEAYANEKLPSYHLKRIVNARVNML